MLACKRHRVRSALRAVLALVAAAWLIEAAGGGADGALALRRRSPVSSVAAATPAAARRAWLAEDAPRRGDGDFAAAYGAADSPLRRLLAPSQRAGDACGSGAGQWCATPALARAQRDGAACAAVSVGADHAAFSASVRAAAPACAVRTFSVAEAFGDGSLSPESSRMWWSPNGYSFVTRPLRELPRRLGLERIELLRVDAPGLAWDLALGAEWFRVRLGQLQLRLPLANRSVAEVDELLRALESAGFACVRLGLQWAAEQGSAPAQPALEVAFVAADEGAAPPVDWLDPTETLIITGASSNHVRGLHGLLRSIVEHGQAGAAGLAGIAVHVWDIGLTPAELAALQAEFPPDGEPAPAASLPVARANASAAALAPAAATDRQIAVRFRYFSFDFSAAPAHFALARETYAWKAEIVGREVLDDEASRGFNPVFWLDAGDRLTTPLDKILGKVRENGASSADASGYALMWTHPLMLQFFLERHWIRAADIGPQDTPCAGGVVALDRDNVRTLSRFVRRWRACAWREECIAPAGSSRANHRQDQAALTLLFIAADVPQRCHYDTPISLGVLTHADGRRRRL